ncbi:MAG: glycosyltransferase family 4 protein [Acidobacteria bacterium]|nr:glycosyltransferase family 4 protein [Acidobacteriota bacterium]
MRLLVVTNDYPPKPGGIQQYLVNLLDAMPHDVRVLAPADLLAADEPSVYRFVKAFMWPTRAVKRWIVAQAVEFRPDVILFGAPHPLAWLGPVLREELGVPYAVLSHGAEITVPAAFPIARQLLRRPLKSADALFAVSEFTQQRLQRLTGRTASYIGGGVDPDGFSAIHRGVPKGPITVGCVARFVPRKGQLRLIKAAERLFDQGITVNLLLVGRGRQEAVIRKAAASSPVSIRVEVDVPWQRLPELYGEMDVFCMPCKSRWGGLEVEGLGLVFLEAASTGLVVIVGDSGGSPETVREGSTGYVVSSIDEIVAAISALDADRELLVDMGTAGRRLVEQEFTWGAVASRMQPELDRIVTES